MGDRESHVELSVPVDVSQMTKTQPTDEMCLFNKELNPVQGVKGYLERGASPAPPLG